MSSPVLSVSVRILLALPQDANILGAGLYNGQFGMFDPRKGAGIAEASPIDKSHR